MKEGRTSERKGEAGIHKQIRRREEEEEMAIGKESGYWMIN